MRLDHPTIDVFDLNRLYGWRPPCRVCQSGEEQAPSPRVDEKGTG